MPILDWQNWRGTVLLPIMTNTQETAVVKAALKNAGIMPKSVRRYLGSVTNEMKREETCEGEFQKILRPHPAAIEDTIGVRNLCMAFRIPGMSLKTATGYEKFSRYKS